MLLTAILDVFGTDERQDIRSAAIRLIRHNAAIWSPYGIYIFWDPAFREVLYVGIDSSLPSRFAQHTGLIPAPVGGCKIDEVNAWFDDNEHLGVTFVVQSGFSQPGQGTAGDGTAAGIMKYGEGQMIEAVKRRTGDLPPWNKIGGSLAGQRHSVEAGEPLAGFDRIVTGHTESLFLARLRLRDLAEDYEAQAYEELLHGARIQALIATLGQGADSHDVLKGLEKVVAWDPSARETATRMVRSHYLEASPIGPAAGHVEPGTHTALASYYISPEPPGRPS